MPDHTPRAADRAEQAVEQYGPMVYRLAYAHTHSRADADDVFQEVFLRYVKKHPVFAGAEHEKAWLIRVTLHRCRDWMTAGYRKHTQPLEEQAVWDAPEDSQLSGALERLPPAYRTVLHLFYYEDLPTVAIARLLHRNESTVRVQLSRARGLLRELLEGEDLDV